jgi:hypothetical protein
MKPNQINVWTISGINYSVERLKSSQLGQFKFVVEAHGNSMGTFYSESSALRSIMDKIDEPSAPCCSDN